MSRPISPRLNACLIASFLVLGACAPEGGAVSDINSGDPAVGGNGGDSDETNTVFEAPDAEECDADVFRSAIGVDIETTAFQPSADVRIFAESDIVTQEYLPKRTNIVTDTRGVITRVYCG